MSRIERHVKIAALLAMLMIAAACGQKSGVWKEGLASAQADGLSAAPGEIDPLTGGVVTADGTVIDPDTGEILSGDSTAGPSGASTTTTTTGGATTGTEDPGSGGGTTAGAPTGGNATGVTDDTIKIGIHAPITGAAPVPSDSANKGSDVYWKWLKSQGKSINGRDVEVVLKNDNYNPSTAVAVCKEMVESDKVFLLSGSAGTDQIQACARYAAGVGVPYLSAGVTEVGLTNLRTYFATSMSYPAQAPLLVDMMISTLGAKGEKNGIVYFNTANFLDAVSAFDEAMKDQGITIYKRAVNKTASAGEAQAVATELQQAQVDNVFILTSPVWFLQLLQASKNNTYPRQWVGVGITMTFDTVAAVGCRNGNLNGAKFLSPFPAWVDSNKYDPNFRKALQEIYPEEGGGDDFEWLGWTGSKGLHGMLELPGKDLTRERFVYFLERAKNLSNGIAPPLTFTPTDHFGASAMHLSEARCSADQRWHTIKDFVSDF